MAPELVAGGGYGGLIREKPHCAWAKQGSSLVKPSYSYYFARFCHPMDGTCKARNMSGDLKRALVHSQQAHSTTNRP